MDSYGEIPFHGNNVDCISFDVELGDKKTGQEISLYSNGEIRNQSCIGDIAFSSLNTPSDSVVNEQFVLVNSTGKQDVVELPITSNLLLYLKRGSKNFPQPQQLIVQQTSPPKANALNRALKEVKRRDNKQLLNTENHVAIDNFQEIEGEKVFHIMEPSETSTETSTTINSDLSNKSDINKTNLASSTDSTINHPKPLELKEYKSKKNKNKQQDEPFKCDECGRAFKESSHLATHARAHIDIRNYKCEYCDLRFKTKTNLFYHTQTHSDTPFTCTDCNKTFPERKTLKRHIRVVHSQTEKHTCDQCNRSFKSEANLTLHYSLHTGSKPFKCSMCPKSFVYKSTLVSHLKAHEAENCTMCSDKEKCTHQPGGRPWLCTICGKGYSLKGILKAHMKTHNPDKPFKCKECPKSFMKKQSYESHIATHNGEGPQFMCDQCSLSYYNVFALKRHYLKHTSSRGFVCEICSKAFWMKDALKVHLRSHQAIKGFPCAHCTKAFAHKHTLDAHIHKSHSTTTQFSTQQEQMKGDVSVNL